MRVATYTRISTDEDHQPFSLGAQQERLLAYSGVQDSWQIVRQFNDTKLPAPPWIARG